MKRRAGGKPSIFYASEKESTAIAETDYCRLRFFSRSPGFTPPSTTTEYTSFSVKLDAQHGIDLTLPPFPHTRHVVILTPLPPHAYAS